MEWGSGTHNVTNAHTVTLLEAWLVTSHLSEEVTKAGSAALASHHSISHPDSTVNLHLSSRPQVICLEYISPFIPEHLTYT